MYVIFAFQSRSHAMKLYTELKKARIGSTIVNTPREISVGCGLSVKIYENQLSGALPVFHSMGSDTFLGAYRLTNDTRYGRVERISI